MLAYGLTYMVDGMITLNELDCSSIIDEFDEWRNDLSSSTDQAEIEQESSFDDEDDDDEADNAIS